MRLVNRLNLVFLFAASSFCLQACEEPIPDGRIMVKNDTQDSEYNIVKVSGGGASYSLKPGDHKLMPRGTTTINFSRAYANFTRRYTVRCPSKIGAGIWMRLIDVHTNRLPGGCETVEASKD